MKDQSWRAVGIILKSPLKIAAQDASPQPHGCEEGTSCCHLSQPRAGESGRCNPAVCRYLAGDMRI